MEEIRIKKKVIWYGVGLWLIIAVVVTLNITVFAYENSDDLYGFPIPKSADLTESWSGFAEYDWSPASEEDGLPFYYKQKIERDGWEEVFREGSLTTYEKDNFKINVISQTDYLSVFKERRQD